MQGFLSEIDIRSILQLIELGQRTGELYLESYTPEETKFMGYPIKDIQELGAVTHHQSWLVFFAHGQVVYAGPTHGGVERLRDHLHRYKIDDSLPDPSTTSAIASFNSPEYGTLWALLERRLLTPEQSRAILSHMIHETLFDVLSLHQGSFVFQLSSALSPQLTTHKTSDLVAELTPQIQVWHQFHPHIQSLHQCPVILNQAAFQASVSVEAYNRLARWMNGSTSIRQMARYLNRDLVTVARSLLPSIQQGLVSLTFPSPSPRNVAVQTDVLWQHRVPRIVCVDDGATIRQTVEQILDQHGYEATSIGNPLKALGLLFQLQPDLILCDILMPELEGYELCAMLRHSSAFRQTPIVMLTGKDGFIDRVRARMVGATDYLTKPFGASELLALVEKYVGPGNPDRPRPDVLLDQALEADHDIDFSEAQQSPR
jgi:twitching motility two-component system response regulator PilG